MQGISTEAWQFMVVCVPIVVIGAPMGAFLGSHFHRLVLAGAVVIATTAALVGAYAIVPMSTTLIILTVSILVGGVTVWGLLSYAGHRIVVSLREKEQVPVLKRAFQGVTVIAAPGGVVNDGYAVDTSDGDSEMSKF